MTAEKLHKEIITIGLKSWEEFLRTDSYEPRQNFNFSSFKLNDIKKVFVKFKNFDKKNANTINSMFSELIVLSLKENYSFHGGPYKIFVEKVLRDSNIKSNHSIGYLREDIIKEHIYELKWFKRKTYFKSDNLIDNEAVTQYLVRSMESQYYFLLLNDDNSTIAYRNIDKSIKSLKRELQNKKSASNNPLIIESERYEYGDRDIEKLAYLNESGILAEMYKKNSAEKIARLIMKIIQFDTGKVDTIARYIRICLNDKDNPHYPKNTEEVSEFLEKIKFKSI